MLVGVRRIDRERIAGATILISLFIILLSMIGILLADAKVSNIELVDRGLYTIITNNGPINVSQEDILRIEKTYTKAAITGTAVELDKIYTTKGFIYISSLDPFYETGNQLINSVDSEGKPVWIPSNNTGSEVTLDQRQRANLSLVKPFNYAIGTSSKLVIVIFSVLSMQYLALSIGGLALIVLIFPLRLGTEIPDQSLMRQDIEFCSNEDQIDAVAK
ncbi:hypothetical protein JCM17380_04420 [Desulfosporosinus burensis]